MDIVCGKTFQLMQKTTASVKGVCVCVHLFSICQECRFALSSLKWFSHVKS